MTREEFIFENPITTAMRERGIKLVGGGNELKAVCPFHADKNPSMSVNVSDGTWYCHACQFGGSVIDFLARMENVSPSEFLKSNQVTKNGSSQPHHSNGAVIEKVYEYLDEVGSPAYEVVRYRPKTFRQRHMVDGKWVWSMEGVTRVLYRLPEVLKSETVWIVEGEKDADNLNSMGFCATCNVGGAGKWLDAYTESLSGKEIIICGDTDTAGKKHVDLIFESVAGKVKTARVIKLPEGVKDVSDYIKSFPTQEEAKQQLESLAISAHKFIKGIHVPIYSMAETEDRYRNYVRNIHCYSLDLSRWMPVLRSVRPLVPGDLALVIGDTGVGKSNVLINIARAAKPLPTILFEMELPIESMYERFMACDRNMPHWEVEKNYIEHDEVAGEKVLDHLFKGLFLCEESGLTVDQIEQHIVRSQLKIGERPRIVLIDYVQLLKGVGKRYERTADNAEQLKVVAKRNGVVIVIASQVHRSDGEEEINLHSAKDSGSLENSASLVIGVWRDTEDLNKMYLKVLKNTKGTSWRDAVECEYLGERSLIRQPQNSNPYPV